MPDIRSAPAGEAKVAVVFLTPACDMACPYCGAAEDFGVLGRGQAVALLDHLVEQRFESVVFGGGEPLRWPHGLRELCAAARARGLLTQVGTNSTHLPEDAATWREVDRWVLPLESDQAEAHDALRPTRASHHAKILATLDAFARHGTEVTVSSVAHRGGEAHLEGVARELKRRQADGLRLHAWHVYRFQAMGRGGLNQADRFSLADQAWAELGRGLKARHRRLPLLLRSDMMHSRQVAFFSARSQGLWRQGPLAWQGPVDLEKSCVLA